MPNDFEVEAYIAELNGDDSQPTAKVHQGNGGRFFESRSHLVAEQLALIAVNRKTAFARKAQKLEQRLSLIAKNREAAIQRRALHPRLRPWAVRPPMANAMESDLRGAGESQTAPSSGIGSSPEACEFVAVFAPQQKRVHRATVARRTIFADTPDLHVRRAPLARRHGGR